MYRTLSIAVGSLLFLTLFTMLFALMSTMNDMRTLRSEITQLRSQVAQLRKEIINLQGGSNFVSTELNVALVAGWCQPKSACEKVSYGTNHPATLDTGEIMVNNSGPTAATFTVPISFGSDVDFCPLATFPACTTIKLGQSVDVIGVGAFRLSGVHDVGP